MGASFSPCAFYDDAEMLDDIDRLLVERTGVSLVKGQVYAYVHRRLMRVCNHLESWGVLAGKATRNPDHQYIGEPSGWKDFWWPTQAPRSVFGLTFTQNTRMTAAVGQSGKWIGFCVALTRKKTLRSPQPKVQENAMSKSTPMTLPADVLAGLYAIGTGQVLHAFMGLCPDQVEGDEVRDDECPACRLLIAADQALAAAGLALPAYVPESN